MAWVIRVEQGQTKSHAIQYRLPLPEAEGLPTATGGHTFRATGMTATLWNGGTVEGAQKIAAHAFPCTVRR